MKLSDFGISKELDGSAAMVKTAVGSYHYMSPERLLSEKYDASGDIWYVCMYVCMYVSLIEKFMSGYYSLPDVCKYVYM